MTKNQMDALAGLQELADSEGWEAEDNEYVSTCPACGDPIDYCQGHGPSGDPAGFAILELHDDDDHSQCAPNSDCVAS